MKDPDLDHPIVHSENEERTGTDSVIAGLDIPQFWTNQYYCIDLFENMDL